MSKKKKIILLVAAALVLLVLFACLAISSVLNGDYAFTRAVSDDERELRLSLVRQAQFWEGTQGGSPEHAQILEIYNAHEPLAQDYVVKPEDKWCATFVSTCAIQTGLTDIIPTECGCQRQIGLWQELGCWEENDSYEPLPGDIIYYSSEAPLTGDCTEWSDHVGIVMGTWHGWIKVIEGNCNNQVACRYIRIDDRSIRGFAIPDYAG